MGMWDKGKHPEWINTPKDKSYLHKYIAGKAIANKSSGKKDRKHDDPHDCFIRIALLQLQAVVGRE